MTQEQRNLFRALLQECSNRAYPTGHGQRYDITSSQNTVLNYSSLINQLKYVHMYFAKHVACWRKLARTLQPDHPTTNLWSVGAGPMLDVIGWFVDAPRVLTSTATVDAVDVLGWNEVRENKTFQDAYRSVHSGTVLYHSETYIPPNSNPPQITRASTSASLHSLPADAIPEDSVVLLPFIMNHLVGAIGALASGERASLATWLNLVCARARLVVLVDIHPTGAPRLWENTCEILGVSVQRDDLAFTFEDEIADFEDVYTDGQERRRCSGWMSRAGVLVGCGGEWYPLC